MITLKIVKAICPVCDVKNSKKKKENNSKAFKRLLGHPTDYRQTMDRQN